ncbi:hypothetical protein CNQ87_15500 [Lysinibacillus fusiformis]|uniref:hypothetical protein n=1 Tax=Lysinibacillus fusiformis TaxID=28031 RepID=UPI0000F38F9E|nr:hypothetical protein [Lysinibacillus fusiformis]EAZ84573.1 hypothetical protein BB14905_21518 [Bacillus sp. B14905]PCD82011.1 hypothetical protein CNQ87_15500 [Lysinibacillus fusiformis]
MKFMLVLLTISIGLFIFLFYKKLISLKNEVNKLPREDKEIKIYHHLIDKEPMENFPDYIYRNIHSNKLNLIIFSSLNCIHCNEIGSVISNITSLYKDINILVIEINGKDNEEKEEVLEYNNHRIYKYKVDIETTQNLSISEFPSFMLIENKILEVKPSLNNLKKSIDKYLKGGETYV